jgi:hypothetical protein
MVYVNVDFQGATGKILDDAVKQGYAKTKAEALRLAVLTLNDRYGLLQAEEELEDTKEVARVESEISSGKQKWLSQKDFEKRVGVKL